MYTKTKGLLVGILIFVLCLGLLCAICFISYTGSGQSVRSSYDRYYSGFFVNFDGTAKVRASACGDFVIYDNVTRDVLIVGKESDELSDCADFRYGEVTIKNRGALVILKGKTVLVEAKTVKEDGVSYIKPIPYILLFIIFAGSLIVGYLGYISYNVTQRGG